MARWIDADAMLDRIHNLYERRAVARWTDEAPAADVAPVRHGHWVKAERRGCVSYADAYAECDHCHKVIFDAWNFDYCPRCGAKMDGDFCQKSNYNQTKS